MPSKPFNDKAAAFKESLQRFTRDSYMNGEEPYILLVRTGKDCSLPEFRALRSLLIKDAKQKGADMQAVEESIYTAKRREDYANGRSDIVLRKINEMVADQEHVGKIYCLPIACGIGKSTAISLKIREVIESDSTDGLLVITDGTDRMADYLEPSFDLNLRDFFERHASMICKIDHASLSEERARAPHCKVLLMTTQRYLQLKQEEIEEFLVWDRGRRTLVLVDEEPHLTKVKTVGITALGIVESALHELLPDGSKENKVKTRCLRIWRDIKTYLTQRIGYHHRQFSGARDFKFYDILTPVVTDDEIEMFLNDIKPYKGRMIGYRERQGLKKHEVYETILATFQLLKEGGLFRKRGQHDNEEHDSAYFVMLDYIGQYTVQGPKFIILDGTADINPEYSLHRDCFYYPDLEDYRRPLLNTTIHLIDFPTGVGKMRKMESRTRRLLFHDIRQRLGIPKDDKSGRRPVVFTYEAVEKIFQREFGSPNTAHFGAIHGRNDFREVAAIAQVGLFAYPLEMYFLYILAMNQPLKEALMEKEPQEQSDEIGTMLNKPDGEVRIFARDMIMTDTVQNLFRGTARNLVCEGYNYFIYFGRSTYLSLVKRIEKYFEDLEAVVIRVDRPPYFQVETIMSRSTSDGQQTGVQVMIDTHDTFYQTNGCEFTTDEYRQKTGLSATTFKRAAQNKVVQDLLKPERVGKGRYVSHGPWRFVAANMDNEEQPENDETDLTNEDDWDDDGFEDEEDDLD